MNQDRRSFIRSALAFVAAVAAPVGRMVAPIGLWIGRAFVVRGNVFTGAHVVEIAEGTPLHIVGNTFTKGAELIIRAVK